MASIALTLLQLATALLMAINNNPSITPEQFIKAQTVANQAIQFAQEVLKNGGGTATTAGPVVGSVTGSTTGSNAGTTNTGTPPTITLTVDGGANTSLHFGQGVKYAWSSTGADFVTFSARRTDNNMPMYNPSIPNDPACQLTPGWMMPGYATANILPAGYSLNGSGGAGWPSGLTPAGYNIPVNAPPTGTWDSTVQGNPNHEQLLTSLDAGAGYSKCGVDRTFAVTATAHSASGQTATAQVSIYFNATTAAQAASMTCQQIVVGYTVRTFCTTGGPGPGGGIGTGPVGSLGTLATSTSSGATNGGTDPNTSSAATSCGKPQQCSATLSGCWVTQFVSNSSGSCTEALFTYSPQCVKAGAPLMCSQANSGTGSNGCPVGWNYYVNGACAQSCPANYHVGADGMNCFPNTTTNSTVVSCHAPLVLKNGACVPATSP